MWFYLRYAAADKFNDWYGPVYVDEDRWWRFAFRLAQLLPPSAQPEFAIWANGGWVIAKAPSTPTPPSETDGQGPQYATTK